MVNKSFEIVILLFFLTQLSFVNAAESVHFNTSFFNASFDVPFETNVPGRNSAEIAFTFFFLRVLPVIYQFCFIYANDRKEILYKDHKDKAVSKVLRCYNDIIQMILPALLLLFPSFLAPYNLYPSILFIILQTYTIIMISASIISFSYSIYDYKNYYFVYDYFKNGKKYFKEDDNAYGFNTLNFFVFVFCLLIQLYGSIDAFNLLFSDFFNLHSKKFRDICKGREMTLNLFTVGYATRTLHLAVITYYFSNALTYHWITATILFSATTTLNFAKTDIHFENPNSSFIYKMDWLYHFKVYTNDINDEDKGLLFY
ncbi:7407_t:CDS:2 [Gigaspora margarita]|uniref:7407_t:CDS:1 n=1 Tax=Gigaspora margarita TaxID=4874 RepID=A0ABM8VWQ7_GIGMA|nr:7407_t:CDS:2 [Gigaspora margarita]